MLARVSGSDRRKPAGSQASRRLAVALFGAALTAMATPALAQSALPSGGAFVRGEGQISQAGPDVMTITQSSQRGVIDWSSFSIASPGQVNILNGQGATLNRVLGGQVSRIDGGLTATGSVYLMNPYGVVVGAGGRVLAGGNFVATTKETSLDAFMAGGPLAFSGGSQASIVNAGSIVSQGGDVVMIASAVTNSGTIEAPRGRVSLVAADEVLLATTNGSDDGLYVATASGGGDLTQDGRIQAAAASLQAAHGNIYALAGNRDGLVQATGTQRIDGQLWLTAPQGAITVGGALSATNAGGAGGRVVVNGREATVTASARISASGSSGGEVLVGTSAFGGTDLAQATTIASGATILAGGPSGGGRIETSGKTVSIGAARIDAGRGGTWLLDPDDLTIDAPAAATISSTLDGGSNVTQATTAGGTGGNGDLTVASAITWTGAGELTLSAYRDLSINAAISGGGMVTLEAGRNATIAAPLTATEVQTGLPAFSGVGATLTITSGGSVTATSGNLALASTTFVNQAGAGALSAAGSWYVVTQDPTTTTLGGLTPDFYQYDIVTSSSPAAAGNGVLYRAAPTVSVTLGTVTKSYDGTTTATLDDGNTTVTGLFAADDWTLDGVYSTKNAGTGLTVTASNFQITEGGLPVYGYAFAAPVPTSTAGEITPAVLTATIVGTPSKTYNATTSATLTSSNYQLTGVAAGETITISGLESQTYDSPAAGARTVTAALTTPDFVAGSGVDLNNYVLPTTAAGAGLINPATLTINGLTANNKVYDGNAVATVNTSGASVFGVISGDSVTVDASGATSFFPSKNVGTNLAVTVSGVALSGASAANYVVTQPTGLVADITRATITISSVSVNDKIYDGTAAATADTSSAVLTGKIAGDDVTITASGLFFASKDVAQNIPIFATGSVIGGADSGNYRAVVSGSVTGDITPRPVTITVTGTPTKIYDGTPTARLSPSDVVISGLVAGEGLTVTQSSGATYASKDAGSRAVTANISASDFQAQPGTLLSNYQLPATVTGTGLINPAPLDIEIIGNPTKPYDGNSNAGLGPSNFQVEGFVPGESATVTQTSGQYSAADAGVWTVTTDLDAGDFNPAPGTLMSNYVIPSPVTGFGTITRIDVDPGFLNAAITGNPTKTYDGTILATLSPSDYTITGFIPGESATITKTTGTYADKNAGQKPVYVSLAPTDFVAGSGTNLDNYNLPTEATGIGTILRAPLTAAIIGNPTRVYNGSTNAFLLSSNYQVNGLVGSETINISASSVVANYDSKNVGARTLATPLAPSNFVYANGALSTNYVLPVQAIGPGTITPAPLVVLSTRALSKVYDTTTAAPLDVSVASLSGLITGDTVTLNTSGAVGTFATRNVGNGIAVTVAGMTLGGADLANYQLFQPTGLSANITPAPLVVANVTAFDKSYDATTVATLDTSAATLQGVLGSDVVSLGSAGVAGAFRQSNIGTNLAVNVSGFSISGGDAGNYSLSQPSGLLADITRAILTGAIISNPTKIYNGSTQATLTAANYSVTGFVAGEGGSITQASNTRYNVADAGSRTVLADVVVSDFTVNPGTSLANYQLPTTISGPGTINKATLLASIINNPTKVYDNTTAAVLTSANYRLNGFVAGQGATVTQTAGTYSSDNVGPRAVTASLTAGDFTGAGATNLANYTLPTTASGPGVITPASVQVINVTAQDKIYDGNTSALLNSGAAALSGVFGADVVTVVSGGASGTFASKNVGVNIPVTATGYAIGGADAGNYTVVQPTGLFADITEATLILASVTKVYDSTLAVPTVGSAYGLSGVVGGDSVSVNAGGITGAYADKNVNTGIGVTLAGVALTGADATNYMIAPTTTNAPIGVITPASLLVIGVLANDKVYDQTATAILNNGGAGLSGVLGSDDVTLQTGGSSGQFYNAGLTAPDANAGVGKPVVAIGYNVTGVDAGNYTVTQPQGLTATIIPAPISLLAVTKIYDGSTALPTASSGYAFSGVYAGDTVTANTLGLSGSYADKNVAGALSGGTVIGGINVTLSGLSLSGASAGNYVISPTVTNQPIGIITPKALTASIIGDPTKVYDTTTAATLASANYDLTGVVAGETITVTETAGVYDSKNAGTRTVSATLDGLDFTAGGGTSLANYTLPTSASGTGHITPAPATVVGAVANSKIYDGTTTATLDNSGTTLGGRLGVDNVILVNTPTGLFADPNVGTAKPVTTTGYALSGPDAGNYVLQQPNYLTANISAALIALTKVTRIYTSGVELPTSSSAYTLAGIVAGDDVSVDTSGIAGFYANKNVNTGIGVTYTGLALGGADAGNYAIGSSRTNAPIGEITPATVTLAGMLANTKIYDGATTLTLNNTGTVVVGTLGTDDLDVDSAASSASFPSANVGTYLVNASGYALTGLDAGNYLLTQPTGISATIDPKALAAAIIGDPTKTYDATAAATLASGNYDLVGFIAGQGATVSQTAGTYASPDAGARLVTATLATGDFTASGGTLLTNYVLPTTATGLSHISQASLAAAIVGDPTKTYDGTTAATLAASNYQLTGFVAGQGASVGQTAGTYDSANAGSRTVTASLSAGNFTANGGTNLANYVLPVSASGAGTIDPKALTATIIGDPTKTYDATTAATLAAGNYSLSGFIGGQGASVSQTVGVYDLADAGLRTVTATLGASDFTATGGALLSNYVLPTTATGAGHISQATLTAAIIGNPTKTYDATTAATLASANYQLTGFVSGQGASVGQTVGTYDSANAGARTVTASLSGGNFTANGGTNLANYVLPVAASGAGTIDPKALTALIIGVPTKTYDATTDITLSAANYRLTGFIAGQGAAVTETAGQFASPDAGARLITATLDPTDFTANGGTLLSNYVLPATATGAGLISKKQLQAVILSDPTKTYDGTQNAVLTTYLLTGFVSGQGAIVLQPTGTYDSVNAGIRVVSAQLGSPNFQANSGTSLSNYALPTRAEGVGHITPQTLTAAIVGNPSKLYDGTTAATLASANYQLTGFITGEGASVGQTAGTYDAADAGARVVTASLSTGDFTASGATLLSNYVLPVSASGAGTIGKAALVASLNGVSKTYDGTTGAALVSTNYTLTGFAAGEGASVTEAVGTYGSANAGLRTVTATLDTGDFVAGGGTNLANYVLPTTASGLGVINRAGLNAVIIGDPTKTYDGGAAATLTSANYVLTGFVSGEGAGVGQTSGTYASSDAGARIVTATLAAGDFSASGATLLDNYVLPTSAAGLGHIDPKGLFVAFGGVTKTYDGTTAATLTPSDFVLAGFVNGQGASVTETQGVYAQANVGLRTLTASLDASDFSADSGTNLANYVLPTSVNGLGRIDPATLIATLGGVSKVYDGNTAAVLASGNYTLTGFAPGEGAVVTETVGAYGSPNAGLRTVTASLDTADFTATGPTLLSNYVLPTMAAGLGAIDRAPLTAAIVGQPVKAYDGTTVATLVSADYALSGFIVGEDASVTQTTGAYDGKDAGAHAVVATLATGDFAASGATLLDNYVLPTSAAGAGRIDPKALTVALAGVSKTYDATTAATLAAGNYVLTGLAPGEGVTIGQTVGAYDSPNAGPRAVNASLSTTDYAAGAGTLLTNYVLPTAASGTGTINRAPLTAVIIGDPTKTYDGTTTATLTSGNYQLAGFVAGQGATVTETVGAYDSKDPGDRTVTATLGADDYSAGTGTLLSNYDLPTSASGPGKILQPPAPPGCEAARSDACQSLFNLARSVGNARFYIPYPVAGGLYQGHTNGLGDLPATFEISLPVVEGNEAEIFGGAPVANSTEDVLLLGERQTRWSLRFVARSTPLEISEAQP